MKGRSEITDAAAVALVQAYKRYELHLSAQSGERTQQTDGWQHLRQTWHALTDELNAQFGLAIKTEQWKKKISNIKTNVKSKKSLAHCDAKVNWSLAELEFDRLFARDCSVLTMSGGSDWNGEAKCRVSSACSDTFDGMPNSIDDLFDRVMSPSKLSITPKVEPVVDSVKKRNTKRSLPDSGTAPPAKMTPSSAHSPQTDIQQLLFGQSLSAGGQKAAESLLLSNLGLYVSMLNAGAGMFDTAGLMAPLHQQQHGSGSLECPSSTGHVEAAHIQRKATEKFSASVDLFNSAVLRFEKLVDRMERVQSATNSPTPAVAINGVAANSSMTTKPPLANGQKAENDMVSARSRSFDSKT